MINAICCLIAMILFLGGIVTLKMASSSSLKLLCIESICKKVNFIHRLIGYHYNDIPWTALMHVIKQYSKYRWNYLVNQIETTHFELDLEELIVGGLMSEAGDARYHARFRQLIQLKTAWENDKDVVVMELQTETFQLENEEVCNSIEISIENEGLDNVDLGNKIQNINTVENYLGNEKSLGNQDNVVLQKEIQIVNVLEDEQNFTSENSEMESRQILISQEVSQTNEKIPIIFNSDDNLNITPHSQLQSVLEDSKDQNCLGDIKLPVAIKKRGRPKGRANTVIGLEEKRRKKRVNNTKKIYGLT
nr:unnamed protein product [Callosobruchus chinensis]